VLITFDILWRYKRRRSQRLICKAFGAMQTLQQPAQIVQVATYICIQECVYIFSRESIYMLMQRRCPFSFFLSLKLHNEWMQQIARKRERAEREREREKASWQAAPNWSPNPWLKPNTFIQRSRTTTTPQQQLLQQLQQGNFWANGWEGVKILKYAFAFPISRALSCSNGSGVLNVIFRTASSN